jgi:uncharacterized lipoprotein YajG
MDLFMNNAYDCIAKSRTIMKSLFILFLVIALAICFTPDPTPTVPEDTIDRTDA